MYVQFRKKQSKNRENMLTNCNRNKIAKKSKMFKFSHKKKSLTSI